MANPVSYTWTPTANLALIASLQTRTGPPAQSFFNLNANGYTSGQGTYSLPFGMSNVISLTAVADNSAIHFTITGLDPYGQLVVGTPFTGPTEGVTKLDPSGQLYTTILSIGMDAGTNGNVSASYSNSGATLPFITSSWATDIQLSYMVVVPVLVVGTVIQPQVTISKMPTYNPQGNLGQQPHYAPVWVSTINATPIPPINATTPGQLFTLPGDTPISAFQFLVTPAVGDVTSSFTARIMQQGGVI